MLSVEKSRLRASLTPETTAGTGSSTKLKRISICPSVFRPSETCAVEQDNSPHSSTAPSLTGSSPGRMKRFSMSRNLSSSQSTSEPTRSETPSSNSCPIHSRSSMTSDSSSSNRKRGTPTRRQRVSWNLSSFSRICSLKREKLSSKIRSVTRPVSSNSEKRLNKSLS
jgi:hypothetical protein